MKNFLNPTLINQVPITKQKNSKNFSSQAIFDEYLCTLSYNFQNSSWEINNKVNAFNGRINGSFTNQVDYGLSPKRDCILLILESPHINEFDINGLPIGPAIGTTGNNIFRYFEKCINSSLSREFRLNLNQSLTYNVVLLNAIQFQCSEGVKPIKKSNRDENFIKLINNENYCDVDKRINWFKQKNSNPIIINACTKGCSKIPLFVHLDGKISNLNLNIFHSSHPSSWWLPFKRKIV